MKRWDVVVVGEIYADHVFSGFQHWPAPGEEVHTDHYLRELGGGTVNTACGLARLQRRVRLVGLIGEADREWFKSRLKSFGLSADGLRCSPLDTGVTVSVSTAQDRSFYTYPGANRRLTELLDDPGTRSELIAARHVHFAMPLAADLARRLFPLLHKAGCTTSLDVGFSPDWLQDPDNHWTCRAVDYFFPNQAEARLLSGDESAEAFRDWAQSVGLRHAVIKLGAAGAAAIVRNDLLRVPPPPVHAVDMTGAGDAFDAGFIDGVLNGESIEHCLQRACICGALCTTRIGALEGLPDLFSLRSTYEQIYGP
ncbi:carbohydrate kinase family protein [Dyella sp. 7MK23]|uniref:Carbohydrate kinase family protein n=2 Tax=Dyella acidiphila TaxID=2775866 RepID=A0ABR9GCT4_9GAMM|nr:carbohydrate kinase family protein [Dyella acidiphila]